MSLCVRACAYEERRKSVGKKSSVCVCVFWGHKSRVGHVYVCVCVTCRTLVHGLVGYYSRQIRDPVTLLMLCHILLTITHFITWSSTHGQQGKRNQLSAFALYACIAHSKLQGLAGTQWYAVVHTRLDQCLYMSIRRTTDPVCVCVSHSQTLTMQPASPVYVSLMI